MRVTINGREQVLGDAADMLLPEVLQSLNLRDDRIAIELNGQIVSRSSWSGTTVVDRDRLEIVHFVGGGSPFS